MSMIIVPIDNQLICVSVLTYMTVYYMHRDVWNIVLTFTFLRNIKCQSDVTFIECFGIYNERRA